MAQDRAIYKVDVTFTVSKSIPLAVWSGMFLYREILRSFEKNNVYFDHSLPKPFTISPIFNAYNNTFVNLGVLDPNNIYKFRFSTMDKKIFENFRESIFSNNEIFKVIKLESNCIKPLSTISQYTSQKGTLLIKVKFAPTIFKFRSFEVLYPSPQRFVMSALRDLYKLTALDLRKQAAKIVSGLELVSHNVKTINLYIGSNSKGDSRYVRAFWGDVIYALAANYHPRLLHALLSIAQTLGVGKNRSIGLGDAHLISISLRSS